MQLLHSGNSNNAWFMYSFLSYRLFETKFSRLSTIFKIINDISWKLVGMKLQTTISMKHTVAVVLHIYTDW